MLSVTTGMSPEGSFGDDLSVIVNGVSGTEGGEAERAGSFGCIRRVPRRSVTFTATGVRASAFIGKVVSDCSAGWEVPLRLTLNLEALLLAFGGGRDERSCSTV